jgi:hypothetical protein
MGSSAISKESRDRPDSGRPGSEVLGSVRVGLGETGLEVTDDGFRPVASRQASGFDGIRGGTQRVRTHVADGCGLTGGSGGGSGRGSLHLAGRDTANESAADLLGSVELSSGERASAGDGSARAVISWRFSLKESQNPLSAVGGPCGDEASVGFAQRLRRSHHPDSTQARRGPFAHLRGGGPDRHGRPRPPFRGRGRPPPARGLPERPRWTSAGCAQSTGCSRSRASSARSSSTACCARSPRPCSACAHGRGLPPLHREPRRRDPHLPVRATGLLRGRRRVPQEVPAARAPRVLSTRRASHRLS